MVLATLCSEMLFPWKRRLNHWFYNIFENSAAKTNGFTTLLKLMLIEPVVLATLSFNRSTVKYCSCSGFGNVVKSMVLPTLFLEMSPVKCFSNCFV